MPDYLDTLSAHVRHLPMGSSERFARHALGRWFKSSRFTPLHACSLAVKDLPAAIGSPLPDEAGLFDIVFA